MREMTSRGRRGPKPRIDYLSWEAMGGSHQQRTCSDLVFKVVLTVMWRIWGAKVYSLFLIGAYTSLSLSEFFRYNPRNGYGASGGKKTDVNIYVPISLSSVHLPTFYLLYFLYRTSTDIIACRSDSPGSLRVCESVLPEHSVLVCLHSVYGQQDGVVMMVTIEPSKPGILTV